MLSYFERGDTHNFYKTLVVAFSWSETLLALMRATYGELNEDNAGIIPRWVEHNSEYLNQTKPTDPTLIKAIPHLSIVEELYLPHSRDEVNKIFASMKCQKSAGLQAELLKYSGDRVHKKKIHYISACWSFEQIPFKWKGFKFIITYKR